MSTHEAEGWQPITMSLGAGQSMEMILCPPGEFYMGSAADDPYAEPDEQPRHLVRITRGFYMARTPMTQEAWAVVMGEELLGYRNRADWQQFPIDGISWLEALECCRRMTTILHSNGELGSDWVIQLPTEAQWEYACRAGSDTTWHFGDDASLLDEYAWWQGNSGNMPHAVAGKLPNAWGFHDMYGGVAEWCLDDRYVSYASLGSPVEDPISCVENSGHKQARGGEYSSDLRWCRSAARGGYNMNNPFRLPTGLRVVCVRSEDAAP